ncbi:transporter substrate-binding domain-containing protein [Neobacillus drentensis]|uniref:transporter substrate-binding domain-containing protein n=1 Tax=Neobacillus drentensis TaxID=220684 RepID=UPI002FFDFE6E
MKKHGYIYLLSFILLVALAGCGQTTKEKKTTTAWDKIKNKGTLVVATSGTLYPASYHEDKANNLTGYDVEVVKEVAKRLHLKAQFKEMGFDGILPSLQSGMVDIGANDIEVMKEREKSFDFSEPYKFSFGSMLVRKKDQSGIHSLTDLKGKKAAGAATSIYSQIAKQYGAQIVTYGNASNDVYLRDVALGRTDVILNDYYLQSIAVKMMPQFNLEINPHLFYMQSSSALVTKKGNKELMSEINSALDAMKKDGTLSKLSKEFFVGLDVTKKPNVKFVNVNVK